MILPLVLREETPDMHRLCDCTVIAQHAVLQIVIAVLHSTRKGSGHEKTTICLIVILRTAHKGHICRTTIGIGIVSRSIITLSLGMLCRGIDTKPVMLVLGKEVKLQAASVDLVIGLLRDVRLMRGLIHQVTSPAELADVVVFKGQLGIIAGLQIRAKTQGLRLQFTQLRVAISVIIVGRSMTSLSKQIHARLVVVCHQRGIEGRVVIRSASPDHCQ